LLINRDVCRGRLWYLTAYAYRPGSCAQDPDDVKVLMVAATEHEREHLQIKGIVCNGGHQAKERARLAKAILSYTPAPDIPVAVGSAGSERTPQPHEYCIEGHDSIDDAGLIADAQASESSLNVIGRCICV
jgi:hypothetical protein